MSIIDQARAIAGDRDAGASELTARLFPLLAEALELGRDATVDVARIVCHGQPVMAPLWNVCAAAVAEHHTPGRFARVRAEIERAPAALAKAASTELRDALTGKPWPIILTLSYSGSVLAAIRALAARHDRPPYTVMVGEGRPRFEGRRMATAIAAAGLETVLTTDAALTTFIDHPNVVVAVGADALLADSWINKVGTRGLAAAASLVGVSVYVIASRDKAADLPIPPRLAAHGPAVEVWPDAPGIDLLNPYFERTPAELATLFLTDAGPVPPDGLAGLTGRSSDLERLLSYVGLRSLSPSEKGPI